MEISRVVKDRVHNGKEITESQLNELDGVELEMMGIHAVEA